MSNISRENMENMENMSQFFRQKLDSISSNNKKSVRARECNLLFQYIVDHFDSFTENFHIELAEVICDKCEMFIKDKTLQSHKYHDLICTCLLLRNMLSLHIHIHNTHNKKNQ
jgi:hypothetical protein